MKIIYYCQHVLGIGHFFRSLEICKAFAGHEVILVTGGSWVPVQLPSHVREMHLPELMMNQEFSILYSPEEGKSVAQVTQERQQLLFSLFETEAPDLFIVELYPFGRKAFRFEIDPILEGIRCGDLPKSRVICSLRDILVEKKNPLVYEARVIDSLNRYFDALLIHADPRVLTLDETFSRLKDITVPIAYTGFVTPKPAPDAGAKLRQQMGINREDILIVASAGGGTVGHILLEAVVEAFEFMNIDKPTHLHVFTGPFLGEDAFERLRQRPNRHLRIFRFTSDFMSYLSGADLSVSMAGYNTCMNIAAAQVPALVWPFPQNREQGLRAARLAQLGILRVLTDEELRPGRLSAIMQKGIALRSRSLVDIDLNGAENTVRWLLGNPAAPERL
ncbi:MAG: glycosyltransferase [Syntrophales bacterium]|nr:glycosyltransferase [Syntrophales bacterium]